MITGIEILSHNQIVLCDHINDRIKLFDGIGEFKGKLNLRYHPSLGLSCD